MRFDKLVEIYLEEFPDKLKNNIHVSDRFMNTGSKPDGFKGDIGIQNPELMSGDLFPQKRKKKKLK